LEVAYEKGWDGNEMMQRRSLAGLRHFALGREPEKDQGAEKAIGGRGLRTTFAERKNIVLGVIEFPIIRPRDTFRLAGCEISQSVSHQLRIYSN
jgi:hypothetical protein